MKTKIILFGSVFYTWQNGIGSDSMVIKNNGVINSRDNKNFVVPIGATLDLNCGTIK